VKPVLRAKYTMVIKGKFKDAWLRKPDASSDAALPCKYIEARKAEEFRGKGFGLSC
jgi:hypothetical protein